MRLATLLPAAVAATGMAIEEPPSKVIAARADPQQTPRQTPLPGAPTSHGCYSSLGSDLQDLGGYNVKRVSSGFCLEVCEEYEVVALKGSKCYCGHKYPPKDSVVEDSNCSYGCPAYPLEACGGIEGGSFYSVFNTGREVDVEYSEPEEASSTTGAADSPSATTEPVETTTPSAEPEGSTGVAGIAAGIVVGVLAVAGIIGGIFFYMRRKRNKEIEEEHRRNAAVNSFMGHKAPSSSGGLSITDSRLDPVMAQRRLSDGSIADNQDYSRKILRVTNA